jgi:IMP cyclohydrolase
MNLEDNISDYPGRGLVFAVDPGGVATWVYFITGRSKASRARRVRADPDGLVVVPTEQSVETDALRHYACARWANDVLVVGNGDHVDILAEGLKRGVPLEQIVVLIEPEPDPPIWTPRIALLMGSKVHFVSVSHSGDQIVRRVHEASCDPGVASVLTTYSGTSLEPIGNAPYAEVRELRNAQAMCEELFYRHLNEQHRVLLLAGSPLQATAPTGGVVVSVELTGN